MKRLIEIQKELKAPKGQYNSFGKYKYRNCEDILEAVKPLLAKQNLALVIEDDIVAIGDRFYVKANACLFDDTGKLLTHATAYAREEDTKKGMDASQLTGATSSYARKYALNGLFAIDDTKDSDTTNKGDSKPTEQPKTEELNSNDIDIIEGLKGMNCKENAFKYFKTYENEVSDLEAFKKLYANFYKTLPSIKQLQEA